MEAPAQPKTTFNIGVLTGGTFVNSIPVTVSMDVDLRSESAPELSKRVDRFHSPLHQGVTEEESSSVEAAQF
jgi:di/tripeptidase